MSYNLILENNFDNKSDNKSISINEISTLSLAFLGDGVYDLLVRRYIVNLKNYPVKKLNELKVSLVNCKAQAESMQKILPLLTQEESEIFKRGRNTKVNSVSKHSTISDYHIATGLETLFGYLYLKGDKNRINELFSQIITDEV